MKFFLLPENGCPLQRDAHLQHCVTSGGTVGAEGVRTCWAKPSHKACEPEHLSLPPERVIPTGTERGICWVKGQLFFRPVDFSFSMSLWGSILKWLCSLWQDLNRHNRKKPHHIAKKRQFWSPLLKLFPWDRWISYPVQSDIAVRMLSMKLLLGFKVESTIP